MIDLARLADEAEIEDLLDVGVLGLRRVRRSLEALGLRSPSLPERPMAVPPAALMAVTICLLMVPAQHHLDHLDGRWESVIL